MIKRKSPREIDFMRKACRIAAGARNLAGSLVKTGATTASINKSIHDYIINAGARPAFLGYRDFPASACISINEEVIHGIPSSRRLKDGDVVSIDIGVEKDGFMGDCAATFIAGEGSPEAKRLIEKTKECFFEAIKYAKPGYRVSDISKAIQNCAEENGYTVVREYVGHGIGRTLHEAPEIPNFVENPRRKPDPRLVQGMTLAIEPMVNEGVCEIEVLEDGWTVITADKRNSAHYENTVLITDGEPEILTVCKSLAENTAGETL